MLFSEEDGKVLFYLSNVIYIGLSIFYITKF